VLLQSPTWSWIRKLSHHHELPWSTYSPLNDDTSIDTLWGSSNKVSIKVPWFYTTKHCLLGKSSTHRQTL
jgi:hypothetical protein